MARNPQLLRALIEDELKKLARLEQSFEQIEAKLVLPPDQVPDYDRGAIGYLLHSFYNGCENIFRAIARFFENDLGADSWHADMLRRMTLEIEGYRPAVIDNALFQVLNDFRGFRHVFRNNYGFELDWERERLVARRFPQALVELRAQIQVFLERLEVLAELSTERGRSP
ncbi:MAG: antitoxin [Halochromatium sp.]|uniref:ribonuclease toxin HepT-like protein n=1 Tax=Halochromatium sp. TaxID=2049430 RepID=UPI00397D3DB5